MDETPIRQEDLIEPPKPQKKKKRKKRRGRVRYAAPLGFLVLLFAVIGVISTVVGGVNLVVRWADDTPLRNELSLAIDPVMQLCPPPFEDAGTAEEQDTLVMAAIYKIAETERIRQLREKDDTCVYELEETMWRMIVPQADVEASFATLFGDKTIREHKTVGEAEYNAAGSCYYVPLTLSTSGYVPVLDTVKKRGDGYTVRVAYVTDADVQVDERGNAIAPTADMAKYVQWFTVEQEGSGNWIIVSVTAEAQPKK